MNMYLWVYKFLIKFFFRFQQMSFVNSIATTKGGRHVDHVCDLIVKGIIDNIKKKNKTGMQVKPFQVRNNS